MKTYIIAGTTVQNGERKLRFSNTQQFIMDVKHKGHSNIELVQLPEPMTKIEAVTYLKTLPAFNDNEFELMAYDLVVG